MKKLPGSMISSDQGSFRGFHPGAQGFLSLQDSPGSLRFSGYSQITTHSKPGSDPGQGESIGWRKHRWVTYKESGKYFFLNIWERASDDSNNSTGGSFPLKFKLHYT